MTNLYCGTLDITCECYTNLSKNPNDIIVFKIQPSSYYHCLTSLKSYLNDVELNRAKRFHFEKDRNRFIICRVLLKFVLAKQTGHDINAIKIEIDSNKKPYLISNKPIHFNLSHTEDMAIIALNNTKVGIDIEYLNKDFDFKEVMTHVYSKFEIDTIINSKNQRHTFYKYWTRKESVVKATGEGINDHLPLLPAMDGNHTVDSNIITNFKNMTVMSFDIDKDHIVSIAFEKQSHETDKLNFYNLPDSIEGLRVFSSS